MSKNVDISNAGFPERLKELRREQKLSIDALADAVGVTSKAVRIWESGTQKTAMEANLLRLADVLGVEFDYLVYGRQRKRARLKWAIPAAVVLVLVAGGLAVLESSRCQMVTVVASQGQLMVRGGLIRMPLWEVGHQSAVRVHRMMDDGDERLIVYGLGGNYPDSGALFARRVCDGEIVWRDAPDMREAERIYGPVGGEAPGYSVRRIIDGDVDGDGTPEVIAQFGHNLWYPNYVRTYRLDGTVMGTYYHCGSIYDLRAVDLDGDGKDEILAGATNNGKAYQGATLFILDDEHLSGASSDSLMMADCPVADSSRVRVVFPAFDQRFMELMGARGDGARLQAGWIQVSRTADGDTQISATISLGEWSLAMTFDAGLHPLSVSPADSFHRLMAGWSEQDKKDFLAGLDGWMANYYRYGALASQ